MYYLISINLISFILMFIDKRKAIHNKYRIKESTLLFISLLGGCFGTLLGMYLFRHKTKKLKFKLVHLFCIIYIVVFIKVKCF